MVNMISKKKKCDHLLWKKIFTLITNKICKWAPTFLRKMVTSTKLDLLVILHWFHVSYIVGSKRHWVHSYKCPFKTRWPCKMEGWKCIHTCYLWRVQDLDTWCMLTKGVVLLSCSLVLWCFSSLYVIVWHAWRFLLPSKWVCLLAP